MDNKNIRCNVKSCEFNNCNSELCSLETIEVKACLNNQSGLASDESMCGSYKCKCDC